MKEMFSFRDHSFIICAYKESPYLEECIKSLKWQTPASNIIITTSTPNEYIQSLADKYSIQMIENCGEHGIAGDWNFALKTAETKLVTIAHQDDVYLPMYTQIMIDEINKAEKPLFFSSAYGELRGSDYVASNRLLNIKKLMMMPISSFPHSKNIRRMVLSFGNPICCPSVTYVKDNKEFELFSNGYKSNLDWQQWEKLSKKDGSFVYYGKPLMLHRIHEDSETSKVIGSDGRKNEDYQMFLNFWPKQIAKILSEVYSKAENSNKL